jgi:GTP cyclohydrolase II
MVAGVKDARHQALMPDVLHFLGIKKITNLISMSNLKYDAIVQSGVEVVNRYEIPEELIPADSRVEIDAKVSERGGSIGRGDVLMVRITDTIGILFEEDDDG